MTAVNKYKRKSNVNGLRFQIISELLSMPTELPADRTLRATRIKQLAKSNGIATKTIRRWLKSYEKFGFSGLTPAYRSTRTDKRLPMCFDEAIERAIAMRASDHTISVVNIIRCLESENPELTNRIKRSTLQKHLQDKGYARRDLVKDAAQHGRKVLGRFQAKARMDLVVGDIKELARNVVWNDERTALINKIYIAILIDNAHRKVLDFQISASGSTDLFLSGLYNVIKIYGRIKALHLDNGSQYKNQKVSESCQLLNIKLKYCRVRAAWQKGSIERLNETIDDYLKEVAKSKSLVFKSFCEGFAERIKLYNETPHANEILNFRSPNQSFNSDPTPLVYLDDLAVANAFEFTRNCLVYGGGYIKLDKKKWRIEPQYIPHHKRVTIVLRPNSSYPEIYTQSDGCIPLKELTIDEHVPKDCFKTAPAQNQHKQEFPIIDLMFREKMKRENRYTTEADFRVYMEQNVYNRMPETPDPEEAFEQLTEQLEGVDEEASSSQSEQAERIKSPYTIIATRAVTSHKEN